MEEKEEDRAAGGGCEETFNSVYSSHHICIGEPCEPNGEDGAGMLVPAGGAWKGRVLLLLLESFLYYLVSRTLTVALNCIC